MDRQPPSLLCFAHGNPSGWEALCIDLDISVQGDTFDDVRALLSKAVGSYIDAAQDEAPDVRAKLLNRRAPWWVSAGMTMRLIAFNVFRGRTREAQASFPVACPA